MVGSSIKKLRRDKNLTQDDLAEKLGVSRQAVCMWEVGKRELRVRMLNKIAKVFGVTTDEIIKLQDMAVLEGEEGSDMKKRKSKIKMMGKEEDMAKKKRQIRSDFQLKAPEAKRVAISGDFNSWSEKGVPLRKEKDGSWRTGMDLKPGRYEYKFIVDGQWWTDPENSNIVNNLHGTQNSVREITN